MYSNAKYHKDQFGNISCIQVMIGDQEWSIPLDPANTDYANLMALVAEGKLTIAPAEGAE